MQTRTIRFGKLSAFALACTLAALFALLTLPASAHAATTFTGAYDTYATAKKITVDTEYVRAWTGADEHSQTEDRHIYTFTAPANGYATVSGTGNFDIDPQTIVDFGDENACSGVAIWFADADQYLIGTIKNWAGTKPVFSTTVPNSEPLLQGKRYYIVVLPQMLMDGESASYTFKLSFKKIVPAANAVTVAKTKVAKTLKANKLKKKARKVALPKATAKHGTVTWKVVSKDKKKVLTLKNGKIQVKKKAKKGKYTIKVRAKVGAALKYKAAQSPVVTVIVKVK